MTAPSIPQEEGHDGWPDPRLPATLDFFHCLAWAVAQAPRANPEVARLLRLQAQTREEPLRGEVLKLVGQFERLVVRYLP